MSFSCVTWPSCDDLRCINGSVLPSVFMSVSVSPPHVLLASFRFSLVCSSCPFIPQFKTPNSSKVQSASWNTPIHDMRPIQDVLGSTNTVLKAAMGKVRLRQTEKLEAFVASWRCCSVITFKKIDFHEKTKCVFFLYTKFVPFSQAHSDQSEASI